MSIARELVLFTVTCLLCSCLQRTLHGSRADEDSNAESRENEVRTALDEMEQKLAAGSTDKVGWHSSFVYSVLHGPRRAELSNRAAIEQRWQALTARMIREAGTDAAALYGDGKRTDKAHPEALKVLKDGLSECSYVRNYRRPQESDALDERYQKYRAQLARAQRLDPDVTSYYAEIGDGHSDITDMRMELVQCEYLVASKRMELADWHVFDIGTKVTSVGCGVATMRLAQRHLGAGNFAEYQFFDWWVGFKPIACNEIPRSSKFKKLYAQPVADAGDLTGKIVVEHGAPYTLSEPGEGTWRIQDMFVYSRDVKFGGTDCPKHVICEYGPESAAQVYLQKFETARHVSARAEFHKKAGRVERCRMLLKDAYTRHEEAEALRKAGWRPAAMFKVAGEPKPVPEADVVARFKVLAELADTRRVGDYCSTRT